MQDENSFIHVHDAALAGLAHLGGRGLGFCFCCKLGPDRLPIVRAQHLTCHSAAGSNFNCGTVFYRDGAVRLPVRNRLLAYA